MLVDGSEANELLAHGVHTQSSATVLEPRSTLNPAYNGTTFEEQLSVSEGIQDRFHSPTKMT